MLLNYEPNFSLQTLFGSKPLNLLLPAISVALFKYQEESDVPFFIIIFLPQNYPHSYLPLWKLERMYMKIRHVEQLLRVLLGTPEIHSLPDFKRWDQVLTRSVQIWMNLSQVNLYKENTYLDHHKTLGMHSIN